MKKMITPFAVLIGVIMLVTVVSPALAATSQISMGPKIPTAATWLSSNWSGYAVTGDSGSVSAVYGSWVVPTVTGSKRETSYSAFWVGIDGFNSATVEQIGTSSDIRNGNAVYYAWYEFYPLQPMMQISTNNLPVSPGDTIYASVTYSSNTFALTITDGSHSYSTSMTTNQLGYTPLRNSAEWIAEAPSSIRGVLPLSNFGTVNYGAQYTSITTTCSATIGGTTNYIGDFSSSTIQQIYMGTQTIRHHSTTTTLKAAPSQLSTDGTSFTITWQHK